MSAPASVKQGNMDIHPLDYLHEAVELVIKVLLSLPSWIQQDGGIIVSNYWSRFAFRLLFGGFFFFITLFIGLISRVGNDILLVLACYRVRWIHGGLATPGSYSLYLFFCSGIRLTWKLTTIWRNNSGS